jgi:hypothetical protein
VVAWWDWVTPTGGLASRLAGEDCLEAASSMFGHMIFTVLAAYYVLTLGVNPLQLVLVVTVIVIPQEMAHEVLITAEETKAKERGQRAHLLAGMSMAEVYRKHRRM